VGAPLGTTEAGTARPGCAEILPLAAGSSQHESMNIDGLLVVDAFLAPHTVIPRHAHENPGLASDEPMGSQHGQIGVRNDLAAACLLWRDVEAGHSSDTGTPVGNGRTTSHLSAAL
jgi:hypothetical protein